MSWRVVLRGACLSLALSSLWGCSLFDRREVVVSEGTPTVVEHHPPPVGGMSGKSRVTRTTVVKQPVQVNQEDEEPAVEEPSPIKQIKAETKLPAPRQDPPAKQTPASNKNASLNNGKNAPLNNGKTAPPAVKTNGPTPPADAANAAAPGQQGEGPALPALEDPLTRHTPTAMGSVMQLPPGESPVERALELTKRLDQLSAEKKALALRISALEEAMQASGKQMTAVTRQVEEAGAEVTRARKDLHTWAEDLREQHARLRQQEKENHELLKMVIATLEKMLGGEAPTGAKLTSIGP